VVFADGGRCLVETAVPDTLIPLDVSADIESRSCDYWNGQDVRGKLSVWKRAKWLTGTIESAKSFKFVHTNPAFIFILLQMFVSTNV
jgi:hypothetical protein